MALVSLTDTSSYYICTEYFLQHLQIQRACHRHRIPARVDSGQRRKLSTRPEPTVRIISGCHHQPPGMMCG